LGNGCTFDMVEWPQDYGCKSGIVLRNVSGGLDSGDFLRDPWTTQEFIFPYLWLLCYQLRLQKLQMSHAHEYTVALLDTTHASLVD
jgi:hypothetical protein